MTPADLCNWRDKLQWSQADLARQLGYSRSYVCQVESGSKPITPTFERKVNKVLTDFRRMLES